MPSVLSKMERAAPQEQARELLSWGWRETPQGWRHKHLINAWPAADAVKLTREALDGGMDPVHRALRGEE